MTCAREWSSAALHFTRLTAEKRSEDSPPIGQGSKGTQDLGFGAAVPVLFTVNPAIPVKLKVRDVDGTPTFMPDDGVPDG